MIKIIPSIVSGDFKEIEKKISSIDGIAEWVELDVSDGVFAENRTIDEPALLNEIDGRAKISAHLMVEMPETVIEEWLEVTDRIVVHFESTENLSILLEKYAHLHQEIVVALNLETSIDVIKPIADKIKSVQLMSIRRLGFQGEDFCPEVKEKIKTLKTNHPNLRVIVDGGIGLLEAEELAGLGADELVVGSAIWRTADPIKAIKNFKSITAK